MNTTLKNIETFNDAELKDSLHLELVHCFLDVSLKISWLQGIVNLLKQFLGATNLALVIFSDNLVLSSYGSSQFLEEASKIEIAYDFLSEPLWKNNKLLVPFSNVGYLYIEWKKKPPNHEFERHKDVFKMLQKSLLIREELSRKERQEQSVSILGNLESILSSSGDLKDKLDSLVQKIALFFKVSRCQLKVFAKSHGVLFENSLSSEYVAQGYVDAISVVPTFEQNWIRKINTGNGVILNLHPEPSLETKSLDIESLLSIKSFLGIPLAYKNKPVGVLVLHECNYKKHWLASEILCLKQIALLLGIFIGKELKHETSAFNEIDLCSNLISVDDFMRELSHVQMQSQVNQSPFSLILIDVSDFRDINLKWGFVAGNLVISQTARFLQRHYGDKYQIARYNNDEFVLILFGVDEKRVRVEVEKLKSKIANICVLGIGPVDYNYSFVTYPTHGKSISEVLSLLGKSMIVSKSRGKGGICGVDELISEPKQFENLKLNSLKSNFVERTSFKTGPELIDIIKKQVNERENKNVCSPDLLDSIQSLALALDAKDSYTEGHSKRVSEYAFMLAKYIGLELNEQEWIRLAACMHDIGKIGIPESILCKPDKLTKEEFEIMKKHPVIGARILKPIKSFDKVANFVLYHHEYWNGFGYPHGLSKTEIPIGSRIVSIVDAYQAMTSDRPYRARLPQEEAIKRLKDGKEKQWDPDLVDAFIKVIA